MRCAHTHRNTHWLEDPWMGFIDWNSWQKFHSHGPSHPIGIIPHISLCNYFFLVLSGSVRRILLLSILRYSPCCQHPRSLSTWHTDFYLTLLSPGLTCSSFSVLDISGLKTHPNSIFSNLDLHSRVGDLGVLQQTLVLSVHTSLMHSEVVGTSNYWHFLRFCDLNYLDFYL